MEDDGKARDWPGLTRRLGLRSNILAWRDYWIEESCFALGREAKALWVEIGDIHNAQSLVDSLLRNNSAERTEAHVKHWLSSMQQRLTDAACGDLATLICPETSEAVPETLVLETTEPGKRLIAAAQKGGLHQRKVVASLLTGEEDSLEQDIESHLRKLCRNAFDIRKL